MSAENYIPPKVWSFEKRNGGTFASIDRPAAIATHDEPLPREFLADGVAGAEYDSLADRHFQGRLIRVRRTGSELEDSALIDYGADLPARVLESGAILLFLAENFSRFIPRSMPEHVQCLLGFFRQVGSAPYLGGGFAHLFCTEVG
jgi:GSH-dependent disulfide-bond oxidoreductase